MDTSRLNHIAGLIARKRSGGKLTGTEQQDLEEWVRASRMNKESYDRIISGRGVIRLRNWRNRSILTALLRN